jgi:hypothetical protein
MNASHLKADSNTANKNDFASFYKEESFVAVFTRRQQINPVHILPYLPSVLLPSGLPTKTQHAFLFCPTYGA